MPAISPIVLTDGSSPVTLTPVGGSSIAGQTRYRSTSASTPAANSEVLFSDKLNANTKVQKQYFRLNHPHTAVSADTGEEIVLGNVTVEINVVVAPSIPNAVRELAIKRAFSAVDAGALSVELTTGEGQW